MKVLEAQNAVLTNLEVYDFLTKQAEQYGTQKRRGPGNLETLRRELIQYFEASPNPLGQKPLPYSTDSISVLITRLRKYNITKGEFIMMVNLRPTSVANLNTVVEEMGTRFTEEEQEDIVAAIVEILGDFPPGEEDGDEMEMAEDGS